MIDSKPAMQLGSENLLSRPSRFFVEGSSPTRVLERGKVRDGRPHEPQSGVFSERFRSRVTPAEERLLPYIFSGMTNKEIAQALGRAESTIKNQVSSILQKFGARSRVCLMSLYWTNSSADRRI